jgi:hypothetical protein
LLIGIGPVAGNIDSRQIAEKMLVSIIPTILFTTVVSHVMSGHFLYKNPRVDPGVKRNKFLATSLPVVKGDINGGNLFAVGCDLKGRRKGSWWLRFAGTGVYSMSVN